MTEQQILKKLKTDYPNLVMDWHPFPKTYRGSEEIKAIILGADPTRIVAGRPQPMVTVFEIHKEDSPYFRSIRKNIDLVDGLSMDNVYVQNFCRNYFSAETSKNSNWADIARSYWGEFLAEELNNMFDPRVPVLATTEFILKAILNNGKADNASNIYRNCVTIPGTDNLLGREIIPFYRHYQYSLEKWDGYRKYLSERFTD